MLMTALMLEDGTYIGLEVSLIHILIIIFTLSLVYKENSILLFILTLSGKKAGEVSLGSGVMKLINFTSS